jgi:RecG-like helicase
MRFSDLVGSVFIGFRRCSRHQIPKSKKHTMPITELITQIDQLVTDGASRSATKPYLSQLYEMAEAMDAEILSLKAQLAESVPKSEADAKDTKIAELEKQIAFERNPATQLARERARQKQDREQGKLPSGRLHRHQP